MENNPLDDLRIGNYIAFGYYSSGNTELLVEKIEEIDESGFVVYPSVGNTMGSQIVEKEKVLAIGNPYGEGEIKGWKGKYDILNKSGIEKILSKK